MDVAHELFRALANTGKANQTRLKTATEFTSADQDGTLVRHALYATWRTRESGDIAERLTWLRTAAKLVAGAVENDHV